MKARRLGWAAVLAAGLAAADADFAPTLEHADTVLSLQGVGTAYYLGVIEVYDAALYGAEPVSQARPLVDGQCLAIRYKKPIKRRDFVRAAETILKRQHAPEQLAGYRAELDRLHGAYRDVEPGDEYRLCYGAQGGLALVLNGTAVTQIANREFARVYFGIWLGDRALSEDLRESLLRGGTDRAG
ncbi:MAG: chalcone isomerase family protein [Thiotrichales bacterium]